MTEDLLVTFGYGGLFVISFLAATLFPLGSEAFVILMIARGYNSVFVLAVATAGNYLGSLTNYYVGMWGVDFVFTRYIQINPNTLQRAQALYQRWGAPVLFFAWAPIVGDALTVISGMLKLRLAVFSFWVLLGKALRYLVVVGLAIYST